jgi:exosortase
VINLPAMPLEVAQACSGIRSLMSLFAVAVIFGYLFEPSTGRRAVLALLSIPIAVAANVARIVGTGLCVQYWDPDKALGFFHEFSGLVMFVVSLMCLYGAHAAMGLFRGKGRQTA